MASSDLVTPKAEESRFDRFRVMTRALRHRNFRLFIVGQFLSIVGTWMQSVALSWLVYRLTHSAVMLGLVGFAGQIPYLILAPVAGVTADRVNRRTLILTTQILSTIQALILAVLTLQNKIDPWHIIVLATGLGVVGVFDMTGRQSFMIEMVGKDDLINGIALNSTIYNGGRVLGPAVAGIMVAMIGEGWCFVVNAASFVAVIVSLLMMRLPAPPIREKVSSYFQHFMEGFNYVRKEPATRALLLLLAISSIVNYPFFVLMPIFADKVLHGGPATLGILMSCTGAGAIIGALILAARTGVRGLSKTVTVATLLYSFALIAFSISRDLHISMLALVCTGAGLMLSVASTNTSLQTIVPDELRGRMVGFYGMAFMGMAPIGSLLSGSLADRIGAPNTVMYGAIVCVVAAIFFNRKRHLVGNALRGAMKQRETETIATAPKNLPPEGTVPASRPWGRRT